MKWNRYFFADDCPYCHGGLLLVSTLVATGQMCLHCDECLCYWLDPNDLGQFEKGKLGMFKEPTEEQIEQAGWRRYCIGKTYEPTDFGLTNDDDEDEEQVTRGPNYPYYPDG